MRPRFGRAAGWLLLLLSACAPAAEILPTPSASIDEVQRRGQPLQALYLLEAQASAVGWTPALARQAGDLWQAAGDPARALDFWQLAGSGASNDVVLARRLAQGAIELHRWTEAADALDHLLALAPDDAWAQLQLGLIRAAFDAEALRRRQGPRDSVLSSSATSIVAAEVDTLSETPSPGRCDAPLANHLSLR